jgi:hypothetical protein
LYRNQVNSAMAIAWPRGNQSGKRSLDVDTAWAIMPSL